MIDRGDGEIYAFGNTVPNIRTRIFFHSWLKTEIVHDIMVDPFYERLRGVKACIMYKTCNNKGVRPCSIEEVLKYGWER